MGRGLWGGGWLGQPMLVFVCGASTPIRAPDKCDFCLCALQCALTLLVCGVLRSLLFILVLL
jgi:hypothetical protein